MNTDKKSRVVAIIVGGLLLSLVVVGVVYAAAVTVDMFDEGNAYIYVNSSQQTAAAEGDHGSILGGEHDLQAAWDSGNQAVLVDIDGFFPLSSNTNLFTFAASPTTMGTATITWDGNDDDGGTTLDHTGLCDPTCENLTGGGTNDGIQVVAVSADHDADITISAYTDADYWSDMTISIEGDLSMQREDLFFDFASFTSQGSSGGVTWSNLGALVLEIDGTVQADLDMTIDYIEANSVREYGDLPVGTYGTTILSANHIPQGLRLGHNCDAESTYNSSSGADGDDTHQASPNDEDGVSPSSLPWSVGASGGEVQVIVESCGSSCYVNGWIDWDNDGSFDDTVGGASEHIVNDENETTDTTHTYTFNTPTTFSNGYYYARFRICTAVDTCDSPTNSQTNISNGEVEDYRWPLGPTAISLSTFDATWSGNKVLVTWETAMEIDTVGFNVWRSTSVDGGYVKVNSSLIPAESLGGVLGGSYSFTDAGVTPGATYYYKLEELEVGGVSNWYGPTSTGDGGPTAAMLSVADTAVAWWPAAAGVAAGAGLTAFVMLRRRRQHL